MSRLHLTTEQERVLDAPEAIPGPRELAWRLARLRRFGGEGSGCVSVAAHSLTVGLLLNAWEQGSELVLLGLLHDAHETITGDVRRPWKSHEQHTVERTVQRALLERYGLSHLAPTPRLAEADGTANTAEAYHLGVWDAAERADGLALSLTQAWAGMEEEHVAEIYSFCLMLLLGHYSKEEVGEI